MQSAEKGTYSSFTDCVLKIVKAEGPGALFKGLGPALLRAFPVNYYLQLLIPRQTQQDSLDVQPVCMSCIKCGKSG